MFDRSVNTHGAVEPMDVPATSVSVPAVAPSLCSKAHVNHMGGESYYPEDPLATLKLVLLSGFLGEPSYYNPATPVLARVKFPSKLETTWFIPILVIG